MTSTIFITRKWTRTRNRHIAFVSIWIKMFSWCIEAWLSIQIVCGYYVVYLSLKWSLCRILSIDSDEILIIINSRRYTCFLMMIEHFQPHNRQNLLYRNSFCISLFGLMQFDGRVCREFMGFWDWTMMIAEAFAKYVVKWEQAKCGGSLRDGRQEERTFDY